MRKHLHFSAYASAVTAVGSHGRRLAWWPHAVVLAPTHTDDADNHNDPNDPHPPQTLTVSHRSHNGQAHTWQSHACTGGEELWD